MAKISVSRDFSSTPGGRFRVMGPDSGEEFRARLVRELRKRPNEIIEVVLDGLEGYGSSFLEEAFGGIIRNKLLAPEEALKRLRITSSPSFNETYAREANQYMLEAAGRING